MLKIKSVPKSDTLVSSTTTSSQKTSLLRAPANSFYCSLMLIKFGEIIFSMRYRLPYEKFIIISSRGNLVFIMHAPFETAYLLFMPKKSLLIVFMGSNVSNENWPVSTTGCDQWSIPWACTDSVWMASESPNFLSLINVPYGNFSISITDT